MKNVKEFKIRLASENEPLADGEQLVYDPCSGKQFVTSGELTDLLKEFVEELGGLEGIVQLTEF